MLKMRVMVIDDEYLMRRHICHSIDWESLGMQVVGEARNGLEGLELIEKVRPDLVLTDINMPEMDGLEFVKKAREGYPDICVIVITGHEEFEYAKQALNEGVFYFLLKPIEQERYEEVLVQAKSQIEQEREQRKLASDMASLREKEQKRRVLKRLATENCEEEKIRKTLEQVWPELRRENLMIAFIKWKNLEPHRFDEGLELLWELIDEVLDTQVVPGMSHCSFLKADNELILLFNNVGSYDTALARIEKASETLEKLVNIQIWAGVSKQMDGYGAIPTLYQQALRALQLKFVRNDCRVIAYQEEKQENYKTEISRMIDTERLLFDLRLNKGESVESCIENVYAELQQSCAIKENGMFASLLLLSVLREFMEENNCRSVYSANELAEKISWLESSESMKTFVSERFEAVLEEVFNGSHTVRNEKVEQAERFIREHYDDKGLSLKTVSAQLFVNASYLSTIFKKEIGITIGEYITGMRLKKAQELLDGEESLTVLEIAERVGFTDQYYFMRCFKKKYGVSPRTYREQRKRTVVS